MPLTIKYRMTDGCEMIQDGFENVTLGFEVNGETRQKLPVVTGHIGESEEVKFGPVYYSSTDPDRGPGSHWPTVWVMNESGATVAKYDMLP